MPKTSAALRRANKKIRAATKLPPRAHAALSRVGVTTVTNAARQARVDKALATRQRNAETRARQAMIADGVLPFEP